MEQFEKGDKRNDYYGNLARHRENLQQAAPENTNGSSGEEEKTATTTNVEMFETVTTATSSSEKPVTVDDVAPSSSNNNNNKEQREPLVLIDTSAYIYRSYHAIPPLHHSDGTPTGAVHGVCRMLQNLLLTRLLKGDRPRVVLTFDVKGPNFRHEVYPEYKANRGPCPDDLVPQFALVREAAEAFGLAQVEAEGFEADDVIATLTKQALEEGVDVDIMSGDKDLMQLITPL